MLMPSIFGEDLFDDWMRLPVERETNRGYRTTELMKTGWQLRAEHGPSGIS